MQADHLAVAGRPQLADSRVDGDAVAQHLLGEHRVGASRPSGSAQPASGAIKRQGLAHGALSADGGLPWGGANQTFPP